jgi:D-alanyl-D-alanine carboxypeptidase
MAAIEQAVDHALEDLPEETEVATIMVVPDVSTEVTATLETVTTDAEQVIELVAVPEAIQPVPETQPTPRPIQLAAAVMPETEPEIVTRAASTGSRLYGVSLGRYPSQHSAERLLLQTALAELGTFGEALRNVVPRSGGYDAQFAGMTAEQADRACLRLMARAVTCTTYGP